MASRVSYRFKKLPEGDQKLPPQAITILQELKALGGEEKKIISRDDLVKKLEEQDGDKPNKLNARQPVERVIAFYQKRLNEEGFLEVHKSQAESTKSEGGKKKSAEGSKGKSKVPEAEPAPEEVADSMKVE